jgi:hypothetical protein
LPEQYFFLGTAMVIDCKKIDIHCDDLGSQISFHHSDEDFEDDSGDYFLIQRYYGDYEEDEEDDAYYYIESSNEDFCGHFDNMSMKLTKSYFELQNKNGEMKIMYDITDEKFAELKRVLKIIVGGNPTIELEIE